MHKIIKHISENKFFLIALTFSFIVMVMSLMPLPDLEKNLQRQDKLVHLFLFFGLFILWVKAFPSKKGMVLLLLFFYGIALEILQATLPVNRSFDKFDIIANTLGLITGWLIMILYDFFRKLF